MEQEIFAMKIMHALFSRLAAFAVLSDRDASALLIGTVLGLTALSIVAAVLWIAPYLKSKEE